MAKAPAPTPTPTYLVVPMTTTRPVEAGTEAFLLAPAALEMAPLAGGRPLPPRSLG